MPRLRADSIARHRALCRAAILDAAEESMIRNGYDGTSLSAVSDLSELPRSTLYEYFAGKDELIAVLVAERVGPLVREWQASLPDDPAARVEAMFTAGLALAARHPGAARILLEARSRLPRAFQERYFPEVAASADDLLASCEQAMEVGAFAEGDPAVLASVIGGLLIGGVETLLASPHPDRAAREQTAVRVGLIRHGASAPVA